MRARRRKPGVTGRLAAPSQEVWQAMMQALWVRARGRCEVPWCRTTTPPLDPHHVEKRSQGGEDSLRNLTLLCRKHHDQTDAPYEDGRLVVTMYEGPDVWLVRFAVIVAPDKATARSASASPAGRPEPEPGGRHE